MTYAEIRGQRLMVVHTGGVLGCASYRLYQLQAHSQTFRKGGDKCVQAITRAT